MKFLSSSVAKLKGSTVIKSSLWVAFGVLGSQVIRLLSNLLLTRLLIPEYFGIMALVYAVTGFFNMVSDIGLIPSIVNTTRDKDDNYMSTAWTIQLIRQVILGVLVLIVAYPVSLAYKQPDLFPLLIIISFTVIASGFKSTAVILEQKYLRQKKLVIMDISTQIISTLTMLIVAYMTGSIYSLVAGNIISTLLTIYISYRFFSPHHSWFNLDSDVTKEIIHFGKWILLASIFGFFVTRGSPVVMGLWLSMRELGIYTIAGVLATAPELIANSLSAKILQPRYRQLLMDGNRAGIQKLRTTFVLLFLPGVVFLAATGDFITKILYSDEYRDAGWVLQILVIGRIGNIFSTSGRALITSIGDSKSLMFNQGISAFITISFMVFGGWLGGFPGVVLANSLSPFIHYINLNFRMSKHHYAQPLKDALLITCTVILVIAIWEVTNAPALENIKALFSLS
ncbi:oligosaccharide flippase family protein [Gynuella sp.]|uniref:oligosaccharide flippase family protein n=1 Tax=Gynuella sp. TaxID=2969146 RepID=UPI003D0F7CBB